MKKTNILFILLLCLGTLCSCEKEDINNEGNNNEDINEPTFDIVGSWYEYKVEQFEDGVIKDMYYDNTIYEIQPDGTLKIDGYVMTYTISDNVLLVAGGIQNYEIIYNNGKEAILKEQGWDEGEYWLCYFRKIEDIGSPSKYISFEDSDFKAYCVKNFDTDGDEEISQKEAWFIIEINVSGGPIKSLAGIEEMPNLNHLECAVNQLSKLDVSKCLKLEYLNCSINSLTELNVSKCTNLKTLYCSCNQLTKLDINNCTNLEELICWSNQLAKLNVSNCANLELLQCFANQLSDLNTSGCTSLKTISCYDNQLTDLKVNGCASLEELYCDNNKLSKLDVCNCMKLGILRCNNNYLSNIDISNCNKLGSIDCNNNQLTSLDVSNCQYMVDLRCGKNQLTSIDVSFSPFLHILWCNDNPYLTEIWMNAKQELTELIYDKDIATIKYKD